MAALPPITQIALQHLSLYESYYKQVNPSGTSVIGAVEAAAFLKRSSLKEGQLHKIWELSDIGGKGYLDKQGLFIALKLIALAQSSKDVSLSNLSLSCAAPVLQADPVRIIAQPPSSAKSWLVKPAEKKKYDTIFETLNPVNGFVSGDRLKPVLLNSKLPVDVLGRVWDMSDIDADGMMDKDEFAVAMHLVYRALEGEAVPYSLPAKLIPPSKRGAAVTSVGAASSVASTTFVPRPSFETSPVLWVVTSAEKLASDGLFLKADGNKDGAVSGHEVRDILMASGLKQPVLAHIWNLCDVRGDGSLNAEQFALAMHLIKKTQNGVEPPNALTPEMMPPSLRGSQDPDLKSLVISQPNDFSAIKELDQITTDIETLVQEKATLQLQISQTEEAMRKTMSEIEDSKNNLEKATASAVELRQVQTEAKNRLDEVDKEKVKYESMLVEVRQQCKDEEQATANLRNQIAMQETSVKSQEEDLVAARKELNGLREEESSLERQLESGRHQLDLLKKSLAAAKQEIGTSRSKINRLSEENQGLSAQIAQYTALNSASMTTAASSNSSAMFPSSADLGALPENLEASFTPHTDVDQISARATAGSSPVSSLSGFSVGSGRVDEEGNDDFKDNDPFKSKSDPFGGTSETEGNDPFNADDPFKSDPFKSDDPFKSVTFADEAFSTDPFRDKDIFASEEDRSQDGDDPFSSDPFNSSTNGMTSTHDAARGGGGDPFQSIDMFEGDAFGSSLPKEPSSSSSDPFMSDPFAPSTSAMLATSSVSHDSQGGDADPFGDPFVSTTASAAAPNTIGSEDPFGSSVGGDSNDPWAAFEDQDSTTRESDNAEAPPVDADEEEQVAWATKQSAKEERKRQKKAKQLSKKEDKAFALALKESVKSASSKSKS